MSDEQSKVGDLRREERIGTAQAAKLLGVSQQAVRNAIEEGRLEGNKDLHGGKVKFTTSREAVEQYRENRTAVSVRKIDKEVAETFSNMIAREVEPVLQFWQQYGGRMMNAHENHNEFLEKQGKKIDNLCEQLGETNRLLQELLEKREEERRPWWKFW